MTLPGCASYAGSMLMLVPVKGSKANRQMANVANATISAGVDYAAGAAGGHFVDKKVGRAPVPFIVGSVSVIGQVATAAMGMENTAVDAALHIGKQMGVGGAGGWMALKKAGKL